MQKINAKTKSERIAEGEAILATVFAQEEVVA